MGFDKILLDLSAVTGELSVTNLPDSAWQEATNKGTMEPILLTLAPQVDFLLATGVGRVSTEEVLRVLTTVIDAVGKSWRNTA